jgi:glycosyltransferase involved in cell wall biosynthesis
MKRLRFVVPAGIDDPARVSGGNVYDRRVRDGLRRRGWTVDVLEAADGRDAEDALRDADGLVLVDGLAAGWGADAVQAAARNTPVVVLAHMVAAAFADADAATTAAERRSIRAAQRVIATSRWTAAQLVTRGLADRSAVTVAAPGVRPVAGSALHDSAFDRPGASRRLLCIGVLAPHKGQDVLVDALAALTDLDWTCTLVGSPHASPAFAADVVRRAEALGARVRMAGVLDDSALDAAYRGCGAVVAPSLVESAGMAIGDARARGIPVIATTAGGIPDTLAGGGAILVPPGDPDALAAALRAWLGSADLRSRLRREARRAAIRMPHWDATVATVERVLEAA